MGLDVKALDRIPKQHLAELDRPLFTVSEAVLPENTNAYIRLKGIPYEVVLNTRIEQGRREVALAHELLHAITELAKIRLSHEQLHVLSLFLITEIIPTIVRYRSTKNGI